MRTAVLIFALTGLFSASGQALAKTDSPLILLIEHQQFSPARLQIPAGEKTKIVVRNRDAMPAEFESYDLSREIVVPGHGEATIYVGPLNAGSYRFFNDFNHDMQGEIVVSAATGKGE